MMSSSEIHIHTSSSTFLTRIEQWFVWLPAIAISSSQCTHKPHNKSVDTSSRGGHDIEELGQGKHTPPHDSPRWARTQLLPAKCTHAQSPSRPSRTTIKAGPAPLSLTTFSAHLLLCTQQGTLHTTPMACNDLCRPCAPAPLANSCNEPCVRQCQDSSVVIQPSTVLVTLPGPILTSFPQSTAVGSSASAAVGSELSYQGVPVSNGAFGYGYGYGLGGLGCYGGRGLGWFGGRRGCYPC
ncbi:uncharacterized protein [Phaenicophaeus curvirostris]|uniref:uncharacterized protein n=2 Tax=Phaenicophaeus curvirostris TaxID=33595 RepID=UPI0037F0CA99